MPDGLTLGRRIGVTDEYLRVWRVILFQQQGAATALGDFIPASEMPTTLPPGAAPQAITQALGGAGAAPIVFTSDQTIFSSELATGQSPGLETYAAGLRIHFTVTKSTTQTPNIAEITIYNLRDGTAQDVIKEFNYCILQAGYEYGNFGTIFSGTIKMYKRGHDNATDSYLKIYASDGDQAINQTTLNQTYPPGTEQKQMIDDAAKKMEKWGVTRGLVDDKAINVPPSARSTTVLGQASDQLRDWANANGAIWHVLDQQFYWAAPSSYDVGDVVNLTAATGLIGFPEVTEVGINLTALINSKVRLRRLIHLDNKYINQYYTPGGASGATFIPVPGGAIQTFLPVSGDGFYTAVQINYEGDSRGMPWYMYMICMAVDSTQTNLLQSVIGGLDWNSLT